MEQLFISTSLLSRSLRVLALPALLVLLCACSSTPTFHTHPEFLQRKEALKRVGLILPTVTMFEEQGSYRTVPRPEWGELAAQRLAEAFTAEAAARQLPLVVIAADSPRAAALADLFAPLDRSIIAHAYQRGGGYVSDEPLHNPVPPFAYEVGPLDELLLDDHLDGVWLISATNLLPTPVARLGDSALIAMSLVSGLGAHPVPALVLDKFELHAALFDRSGTLLFHCIVADLRLSTPPGQEDEEGTETSGTGLVDLRDDRYARAAIKSILSLYRQGLNR